MSERVVWILGAGFSKPLGGPLLQDLFRKSLDDKIVAKLNSLAGGARAKLDWLDPLERSIEQLRAAYAASYADIGERPWTNAEEFLEYVDLAASGDPVAYAVVAHAMRESNAGSPGYPEGIRTFAQAVRRYLACACHYFIQDPNVIDKLERWQPYTRWGQRLQPQDHVISFNYDVVVELVASNITLFTPRNDSADPQEALDAAKSAGLRLIKPHGSVSLAHLRDASDPVLCDPWGSIKTDAKFAIAAPGPDKLSSSTSVFKAHWDLACDVVKAADVIVIVGYRMPETDSYARHRLMEAIGAVRPGAAVRIVLGPRRDEHVERLCGMLRWAGRRQERVKHEPMWAQDFLAVFDRDRLWVHPSEQL